MGSDTPTPKDLVESIQQLANDLTDEFNDGKWEEALGSIELLERDIFTLRPQLQDKL